MAGDQGAVLRRLEQILGSLQTSCWDPRKTQLGPSGFAGLGVSWPFCLFCFVSRAPRVVCVCVCVFFFGSLEIPGEAEGTSDIAEVASAEAGVLLSGTLTSEATSTPRPTPMDAF